MGNNYKCKAKKNKCFRICKETQDIGFVLLIFGLVTLCALFLPPKAWLIMLGIILILCGFSLMRR